jgi:aryl-alcohol dehydrogenase-like predicted oxidoreductase
VLAQNEDIITIPGTKRIKYLEENIGSDNVQLTGDDLQRIEAIMPAGIVPGARYPEKFLTVLNR